MIEGVGFWYWEVTVVGPLQRGRHYVRYGAPADWQWGFKAGFHVGRVFTLCGLSFNGKTSTRAKLCLQCGLIASGKEPPVEL